MGCVFGFKDICQEHQTNYRARTADNGSLLDEIFCGTQIQQLLDLVYQIAGPHQFRNIGVGSCGQTKLFELRLKAHGLDDHRDVDRLSVGTDHPAQLDSVQAGHHEIQNNQVRRHLVQHGEGLLSVAGLPYHETAPCQEQVHQVQSSVAIVYNQNFTAHHSNSAKNVLCVAFRHTKSIL